MRGDGYGPVSLPGSIPGPCAKRCRKYGRPDGGSLGAKTGWQPERRPAPLVGRGYARRRFARKTNMGKHGRFEGVPADLPVRFRGRAPGPNGPSVLLPKRGGGIRPVRGRKERTMDKHTMRRALEIKVAMAKVTNAGIIHLTAEDAESLIGMLGEQEQES